jgi:pimeloyl-ACP methyl ester carboxylesterase
VLPLIQEPGLKNLKEFKMRLKEPSDGNFASHNTGIVLFNQFGATGAQDAGRDAQVLADTFHIPVVAVDRPGTGGFTVHPKLAKRLSTPDGYLAEMSQLGATIDAAVENLGIEHLIVSGRSAGALGALALARSETVSSLDSVFAAEPIACENVPEKEGFKRYTEYLKEQKEQIDAASSEELVKPLPPGLPLFPAIGRILSIPKAALVDKFHNQAIFASDASLQYATYIAENMSQVDTTLEFAEHSLVATPEVYENVLLPIAKLRTEGGAPFMLKQPKGTVHASFDNRGYMNQVIEPTVTRALLRAA